MASLGRPTVKDKKALLFLFLFVVLESTREVHSETVAEGDSFTLTCRIVYSPTSPSNFLWSFYSPTDPETPELILIRLAGSSPDTAEIESNQFKGRVSLVGADGTDLRITNLTREDTGRYRCNQGRNINDEDVTLQVKYAPDPPSEVKVEAAGAFFFSVSFVAEHSGGYQQTICLQVREAGEQGWTETNPDVCRVSLQQGSSGSIEIKGLSPSTKYHVCVIARNSLGDSGCRGGFNMITTTTDEVTYFNASIKVFGEPFHSSSPVHPENVQLYNKITTAVEGVLKPRHLYVMVSILRFREDPSTGGITVYMRINCGYKDMHEVVDMLERAVQGGNIEDLTVDRTFIQINGTVPAIMRPTPGVAAPQSSEQALGLGLGLGILAIVAMAIVAIVVVCRKTRPDEAGAQPPRGTEFADRYLELARLLGVDNVTNSTPNVSNMQSPVTGYYESRDFGKLLKELENNNTVVIHGHPGVGKSQAASMFAQQLKDQENCSVLWFFGGTKNEAVGLSRETVQKGVMDLAKSLGVSGKTSETPRKIVEALNTRTSLLVFDDVQDIEVIPLEFLSGTGNVRVLITSRNKKLHGSMPVVKMEGFTPQEILQFMRQDQYQEVFEQTPDEDLILLGQRLGNLPHGLSVSRSYLWATRKTVKNYIKELDDISRRGDPKKAIFAATQLNLKQRMSESSRGMFKFTAFTAQDKIPVFILYEAQKMLHEGDPDTDEFVQDVEAVSLANVSGSSDEKDERTLTVHQLTQTAVRDMVETKEQQERIQALLKALFLFFNKDTRTVRSGNLCDLLLPHVEAVLGHPISSRLPTSFCCLIARLHETIGYVYCQKRLPGIAETHLDKAKKTIFQDTLDPPLAVDASIIMDVDQLFNLISKKGKKLYSGNVYVKGLSNRYLSINDVNVLMSKVPEMSEFLNAASQCKPISDQQYKLLMEHGVAHDQKEVMKSYLVELVATLLYTSGRRFLVLEDEAKADYLETADWELKLSYQLSKKLQEGGVQIFNTVASKRSGTLLLLRQRNEKSYEDWKNDVLETIKEYEDLLRDENDYYENGILKRIGHDNFHAMYCYREIANCYVDLINNTNDVDERKGFMQEHIKNANQMTQEAESQVVHGDSPKLLPDVYNRRGEFIVRMYQKGFQEYLPPEESVALEDAKGWFDKALGVEAIEPRDEAAAYLGKGKVYTLMYEEKLEEARTLEEATSEKDPLLSVQVENVFLLDEAKTALSECYKICIEKLPTQNKIIDEVKIWAVKITEHKSAVPMYLESSV